MKRNLDYNILIVDDEMGPRESLKMILKPYYNVFTAEHGEEALKIIKEHPIDLATLDFKMSGMTGTELLKEIRKFNDEVAVIMITGYGTMKSAVEGIRYGAADYLVKPFEIIEIIDIVQKNIEKKKAKSQLKNFVGELVQVMGLPLPKGDISNIGSMRAYILKKMEICMRGFDPKNNYIEMVSSLIKDLIISAEENNPLMKDHSIKVAYFANLLGKKLKLNSQSQNDLQTAAMLHDFGMFGIGYHYLHFDKNEFAPPVGYTVRKAEFGATFCKILNLPESIMKGIAHQTERFDGNGLPDHLSGDQIPLISRIIHISEQYVEWYSKSNDNQFVIGQLREGSGKEFDPELVYHMIDIVSDSHLAPAS